MLYIVGTISEYYDSALDKEVCNHPGGNHLKGYRLGKYLNGIGDKIRISWDLEGKT